MDSNVIARSGKDLKRELGLASATALVAGECIAVGIFLTPAGMAKALGSPMWLLAVWLAVGAMTMTGALCFGELAAVFPGPAADTCTCGKLSARVSHFSTAGCVFWSWTPA